MAWRRKCHNGWLIINGVMSATEMANVASGNLQQSSLIRPAILFWLAGISNSSAARRLKAGSYLLWLAAAGGGESCG